jgi:hypothetical protein
MCSPEAETKGGGRISRTTMDDVLLLSSCHVVLQGHQTTGSGALDAARCRAAPGDGGFLRRATERANRRRLVAATWRAPAGGGAARLGARQGKARKLGLGFIGALVARRGAHARKRLRWRRPCPTWTHLHFGPDGPRRLTAGPGGLRGDGSGLRARPG